jgi:Holliday junction resolvase-like predicted endonuclease
VRTRFGEIDLICRDASGYAFVEVKTRRAGSFVAAAELLTPGRPRASPRSHRAGWRTAANADAVWRIVIAALTVGPDGTRVELVDLDRS